MAVPTDLQSIITKVRQITQRPSESQISDADITELINTVMLYDLPEDVRLQNLHGTFTFYTQPYQDKYVENDDATSPLYQFLQKYYTFNQPLFVGGFLTPFFQDVNLFYNAFNTVPANNLIALGDGTTDTFTGNTGTFQQTVINNQQGQVIVKESVIVSSMDVDSVAMTLIDYPVSVAEGTLAAPVSTVVPPVDPDNYIDYLTGNYKITFASPPKAGAEIRMQFLPYQTSIPAGVLWYDNAFIMRPVPDQVYKVTIEAFVQPQELLTLQSNPKLKEWFQFIAYLTSEKVFELAGDYESLERVAPTVQKYREYSIARTEGQLATTSSWTIYNQQTEGMNSGNSTGNGYWS